MSNQNKQLSWLFVVTQIAVTCCVGHSEVLKPSTLAKTFAPHQQIWQVDYTTRSLALDLLSSCEQYWDLTWPRSVLSFSHQCPQWVSLPENPALNTLEFFHTHYRCSSDFGFCMLVSSMSFLLDGMSHLSATLCHTVPRAEDGWGICWKSLFSWLKITWRIEKTGESGIMTIWGTSPLLILQIHSLHQVATSLFPMLLFGAVNTRPVQRSPPFFTGSVFGPIVMLPSRWDGGKNIVL